MALHADRPDGGRRDACCRRAASAMMKVKSSHQSSRGRCSAQPGCGTIILCGLAALATISPVRVDQHALRFERADVDAEIVLHWMIVVAVEAEFRVDPLQCRRRAAASGRRGRRGRRPRARNACSAPGSRDRSPRRPRRRAAHRRNRSARRYGRFAAAACFSAFAVVSNSATSAGCGMVPFSVPRPWKLNTCSSPGPPPSRTSPRAVMSGVSVARIRSSWMAMSGFSACAAVKRAAQVELLLHREDEMHRRPLRARPSARAPLRRITAQPARSSTDVPAMRSPASSSTRG